MLSWKKYCQDEIKSLKPILQDLGFALSEEQIYIGGERYAFFSEPKLVLVGERLSDKLKVIIKVSSDPGGIAEINHERQCRQVLEKIKFAYYVFFSPPEILYQLKDNRVIFITKYIEQECQFLDRPQRDQFFLALKGLTVQEGAQIATYEHAREISKYFAVWTAADYLKKFDEYQGIIDNQLLSLFERARNFLNNNLKATDLYGGFLTHWDFVPHNIRIHNNNIYLLDHSSIRFGNKHESWARFINFMALYNPELADQLLFYIDKNRPASEKISLQAMRVFRLAEIIWYYTNTLSRADGNLKILNQERINFWANLLATILENRELETSVIENYKKKRDSLRGEEEKKRQEKLH